MLGALGIQIDQVSFSREAAVSVAATGMARCWEAKSCRYHTSPCASICEAYGAACTQSMWKHVKVRACLLKHGLRTVRRCLHAFHPHFPLAARMVGVLIGTSIDWARILHHWTFLASCIAIYGYTYDHEDTSRDPSLQLCSDLVYDALAFPKGKLPQSERALSSSC